MRISVFLHRVPCNVYREPVLRGIRMSGVGAWLDRTPWQRPRRWVPLKGFCEVKYLRVDVPGASMATLQKRATYKGGRKARRATKRIRAWTRGAYISQSFALIAGVLLGGAYMMASALRGWLGKAA